MSDQLGSEDVYFATREEQLLHSLERRHGLSRRQLLLLGAASLPIVAGFARLAAPPPARAARLVGNSPIAKPLPPEWFDVFPTNAEMRWDAAADLGYTIPNERFFVRDHTLTPTIDASTWRLSVFGTGLEDAPDANHPVQFTYQDLLRMPEHKLTCFVECAGNGRSYFASQQGTPAGGTQWHLGAIGVAEWRGVRLSEVLRRAGIQRNAVDVMPSGLDPTVVSGGVDAGHVRRPMPASKAVDDVLLAYAMNDEPLPLDHGFPLRVVVPGWVGIASIKWVGQIEVSATPLYSLWNTAQYRFIGPTYPVDAPPLTNQPIKSAFELARGATFPAGVPQELTGRSWTGTGRDIHRVEVSADGGATWERAKLHGPRHDQAWARWSFRWTPDAPGAYTLMARATDKDGTTQPETVPFNTGGYLFGAVVEHPVTVT
jgi:DMSO/TMAO reductase YedYZ molybdopterin-dependent catalytic subunit